MKTLLNWWQRLTMGESRLELLLRRMADAELRLRVLEEENRRLRGL